MGAAVGVAIRGEVLWASEGRSRATTRRATPFTDVRSLEELVRRSHVVLSICPPAIAEEIAAHVFGLGFEGLYVDANAISPARMRRIASLGRRVVDGSIIASTGINLYLAGRDADEVAALFGNGVKTLGVGGQVGAASALKMAFGGWNKIGIGVTAQSYAIARAYGVSDHLEAEGVSSERLSRMAGRAWRWAPEMEEIADTCAELGLPDEIPRGAATLYGRWERHRDSAPGLDELLEDLGAGPS
jgi:3-hydroxyisobutyrate dehydrogenase-like beta-hydroxyacid dehydrogenase